MTTTRFTYGCLMFCAGAVCMFGVLIGIRVNAVRSIRRSAQIAQESIVISTDRLSSYGVDFSWLRSAKSYQHGHFLVVLSQSGERGAVHFAGQSGDRLSAIFNPGSNEWQNTIVVWDTVGNSVIIRDRDFDGVIDSLDYTTRNHSNIVSVVDENFNGHIDLRAEWTDAGYPLKVRSSSEGEH